MRDLRTLPILVTLLTLAGCATNPVTGHSELSLVSQSQEISMGKEGATDVATTIGLYPDSAVQRYVTTLGRSLAVHTQRPNLPWQFQVVDDPAVNAFALPGGYIFVTRGLLTHMNSESELATVLGHEAGHVAAKHSVKQMSQAQLAMIGLGIGMAVSKDVAQYAGVAQAGLGILFLKFSRDDERQADQLGFAYALADSFDVRQMVPVFQMLDGVGKLAGGSKLPEWQSTHPDPQNRVAATNARVAAVTADLSKYTIGRERYLKMIDGMVYGDDPRNGYFQGTLFVQPALKFRFQFPDGWKTQNRADAVLGVSAGEDAVIELRIVAGPAAAASRKFLAQKGVTAGLASGAAPPGFSTITTDFTAQDSGRAEVEGIVAFADHGGLTYRILAYTTAAKYAGYALTLRRSVASLEQLTDPKALAVQPQRVRVQVVKRSMTLADFNVQYPSSIPLVELALVNGVGETEVLKAGQLVKQVR